MWPANKQSYEASELLKLEETAEKIMKSSRLAKRIEIFDASEKHGRNSSFEGLYSVSSYYQRPHAIMKLRTFEITVSVFQSISSLMDNDYA